MGAFYPHRCCRFIFEARTGQPGLPPRTPFLPKQEILVDTCILPKGCPCKPKTVVCWDA
ncbi:MAG: hypothetical protein ACI8V2_004205, partial [Candidatus Latescibacterota bacterium]